MFTGTASPNMTPPVLTQAIYNNQTNVLTLSFNENVKRDSLNVNPAGMSVKGINGTAVLTISDFQGLGVDGTQITMNLSAATAQAIAALTSPWTITLAAGSIKDSSLNPIAQTSVALTINNPPAVTSASYDEGTGALTLNFNKAIEINSTQLNIEDITMTRSGGSVTLGVNDTIMTTANGTQLIIALSSADVAMWNTTTPSSTYITYLVGAFTDTTSNALTNQATTGTGILLTYISNTTPPSVIGASYNDETAELILSFSKKVVYSQVTVGNFSVFNGANKLFTLTETAAETTAGYDSSVLTFTLTTADQTAIEGTSGYQASTVNLLVEYSANAVVDESQNACLANTTGIPITYTDLTSPIISSATSLSATMVQIIFSKKLSSATAANIANYTVSNASNPTQQLIITSATLSYDCTTVTLTTSLQSAAYWKVTVTNVQDTTGNTIVANDSTNVEIFTGAVNTNLVLVTNINNQVIDAENNGTLSAGDYIILTFNKNIMINTTSIDGTAFAINGVPLTPTTATNFFGTGYSITTGPTAANVEIIFGSLPSVYATQEAWLQAVFGATIDIASGGTTMIYESTTTSPSIGTAPNAAQPASPSTANKIMPTVTTVPSLVSVTYSNDSGTGKIGPGDHLIFQFGVPVVVDPNFSPNDITLSPTVAGGIVNWGTVTFSNPVILNPNTSGNGNQLQVMIASGTPKFDKDGTGVFLNGVQARVANTPTHIFSTWGVSGAGVNDTPVTITSNDTIRPLLVSAQTINYVPGQDNCAGDTLVLTFSKPVQIYGTLTSNDFVFGYAGGTLGSATFSQGSNYRIIYVALANDTRLYGNMDVITNGTVKIRDASGNCVNSSPSTSNGQPAITITSLDYTTDTVLPTIVNMYEYDTNHDGKIDKLTIQFSEPMNTSSMDITSIISCLTYNPNYYDPNNLAANPAIPITGAILATDFTGTIDPNALNDNFITIDLSSTTVCSASITGKLAWKFTAAVAGKFTDLAGNALMTAVFNSAINNTVVVDKAAPVIMVTDAATTATDSNSDGKLNTVSFKFNKPIVMKGTLSNTLSASNTFSSLTVNNGAADVPLVPVSYAVTGSNILTITLDGNVAGTGQVKANFVNADLNNYVADASGNRAVAINMNASDTAHTIVDTFAPLILVTDANTKATDSNADGKLDTVSFKFNKPIAIIGTLSNTLDANHTFSSLTVNNGAADVSLVPVSYAVSGLIQIY